jgi:hypothetical protein|tara:strand:+ start:3108 stop:3260 length:153 start_codon:yes stop_codon:yes gene_type:complete
MGIPQVGPHRYPVASFAQDTMCKKTTMFKSAAFYAIFTDHSRGLLRLFYL